MHDAPDDDPLTRRLLEGEDDVLGELFARHGERHRRAVQLRMDPRLVGRVDPEDVLQEAYLDASKRLVHFRKHPSTSFFVWSRMIVMQTLIDVSRRHLTAQMRDVRAEVSLHANWTEGTGTGALAERICSALTSPTRAARKAELAERLEKVLEDLSELDREILVLRHFEELTNKEAAEVLGIHKAASANRYLRALRRLESALSDLPDFDGELPT